MAICRSCGKEIPSEAIFCPKCGIVVKRDVSATRSEGQAKWYKTAPRSFVALFFLGFVIAVTGFLVILLHELAGWFTLGMALTIMFVCIVTSIMIWIASYLLMRKKI